MWKKWINDSNPWISIVISMISHFMMHQTPILQFLISLMFEMKSPKIISEIRILKLFHEGFISFFIFYCNYILKIEILIVFWNCLKQRSWNWIIFYFFYLFVWFGFWGLLILQKKKKKFSILSRNVVNPISFLIAHLLDLISNFQT